MKKAKAEVKRKKDEVPGKGTLNSDESRAGVQRTTPNIKPETLAELQARGVVGLTKSQMAAALQISVRTLNGMMARREIDYWRLRRRLVRFHIQDAVRRLNETVLVSTDEGGAN